jgi:hypothetical protein
MFCGRLPRVECFFSATAHSFWTTQHRDGGPVSVDHRFTFFRHQVMCGPCQRAAPIRSLEVSPRELHTRRCPRVNPEGDLPAHIVHAVHVQ